MSDLLVSHSGRRFVGVLYGPSGCGKSELAKKLVSNSQSRSPSRYACAVFEPAFASSCSRFTDVFLVDASSEKTIVDELKSIAASKHAGESAKELRGLALRYSTRF